jgi:cytoskeletal protein RodZ
MDTLFQQLKKAREAKGLSIADISAATNIGAGFIEAIENGNTGILPAVYVRAFIREYSELVGIDPQEAMQMLDAGERSVPVTAHVEPEKPSVSSLPAIEERKPPGFAASSRVIVTILLLALLAVILYWNLSDQATDTNNVVEDGVIPPPARQQETGTRADDRSAPPMVDSLFLLAQTTDSVWLKIVVDSHDPLEYLLRPNSTRSWTAKQSFILSVGRPRAVRFTLNDRPMEEISSTGVVRDVLITRETLERLSEQR